MTTPTLSQQKAIEARGNVLVVAGAGTGKTSTLAQRCLALLEQGCSIENILMVTFTEAAAAEMRARIRDALLKRANAPDSSGQHTRFREQLALLETARISTLHSFCLQLVREHFYELGLDPDLFVLDEQQTRPLVRRLLDRLFEQHYAGTSDRDRAVQQLVRLHGNNSDEPIRNLVLRLHRYSQSLADPEAWLHEQIEYFSQPEPARWIEWLTEGFNEWRALWLPALDSCTGTWAVNLARAALLNVPAHPSCDQIHAALAAIRTADEDKNNWPRGSKKAVRDPLKSFFDETRFLESLAKTNGAPLAEDWGRVRHHMLALLELTREFTRAFAQAKRELGGVDFADLEQCALRVLRNPQGGPSAVARYWQRQIEYIFVDEYQDINAAQDKIIELLSRGMDSKSAAAGNRFLVGDVKQSIYRFRLADPSIFRRHERQWDQGQGGRRLPLTDNFRSRVGILSFVNRLFGSLMRESVGGVAYEPLQPGTKNGSAPGSGDPAPCVELHLIRRDDAQNNGSTDDENGQENSNGNGSDLSETAELADLLVTEREARLVGLRLLELKASGFEVRDRATNQLRPVQWRDMAVLLRSPAPRIEAFAKEFSALGIPVEAGRGGFFHSIEVSDLVCLLHLLDNPMQDIPLLAVLRSPLVGMSPAELAEVRAAVKPDGTNRSFWLAARQYVVLGPREHSAWRKLSEFFTRLDRWRALARHSPVSHCLQTAMAETHYEIQLRAGDRGEQQLANVRRLLDLAREYDPFQRQGLFRFLRFIKAQQDSEPESEPAAVGSDAVRITSIHASKGLEFPIVVLAGMGWRFNTRDLSDAILLDEQYGICPKVTAADGDLRYPSLPHWLARQRQRCELLGEELRLMYVAMTRARDRLILTGTLTRKGDGRWQCASPAPPADRAMLSARCYLDWLNLWLPGVTREEDWKNDTEGESDLLRWNIYSQTDDRLIAPKREEGEITTPEFAGAEETFTEVRRRIQWTYPSVAATTQRAKVSVTELRRSIEEESEPAPFILRQSFALPRSIAAEPGRTAILTAAEIGVAHHRFLQRLALSKAGTIADLQTEAERLQKEGWLDPDAVATLDLEAVRTFWTSDVGRRIASNEGAVRRELQFTAGLSMAQLAELGLLRTAGEPPPARLLDEEIVVIQGVVDLAVMLPDGICLVDFKTDAVTQKDLDTKIRMYAPQLQLYAFALSQIYRKPVTECGLYFLSARRWAPLEVRR